MDSKNAGCPVPDCQIPVDVILRSSDGALIGAHTENLAQYSEAFPPSNTVSTPREPIDLTEGTATLQLLMHFVHKSQYPDIYDLSEEELFDLAHAAEKYVIHNAMGMCHLCIRARLHSFPSRALGYAVKYNYTNLGDLAAPLTLPKDSAHMAERMDSDRGMYAWLRYKMAYMESINQVLSREGIPGRVPMAIWARGSRDVNPTCGRFQAYAKLVVDAIPGLDFIYLSENTGKALEGIFNQEFSARCLGFGCKCTEARITWKMDAVGLIRSMPKFSSYVVSI